MLLLKDCQFFWQFFFFKFSKSPDIIRNVNKNSKPSDNLLCLMDGQPFLQWGITLNNKAIFYNVILRWTVLQNQQSLWKQCPSFSQVSFAFRYWSTSKYWSTSLKINKKQCKWSKMLLIPLRCHKFMLCCIFFFGLQIRKVCWRSL